jgi:hypothetical protein
MGVAGENHAYYHLTATDFAGNEGQEATLAGAMDAGEAPAVPRAYALHPARPNPSRGLTAIRFDLPEAARVRLRVLDPTGRVVVTLVREELHAGSFEIPWRGRDDGGAPVAAGIYFYRLDAGAFTQTQKLLLTK